MRMLSRFLIQVDFESQFNLCQQVGQRSEIQGPIAKTAKAALGDFIGELKYTEDERVQNVTLAQVDLIASEINLTLQQGYEQ